MILIQVTILMYSVQISTVMVIIIIHTKMVYLMCVCMAYFVYLSPLTSPTITFKLSSKEASNSNNNGSIREIIVNLVHMECLSHWDEGCYGEMIG